jgi:hypothetical protein
MSAAELVHTAGRKGSYSGHANSNCVEVAVAGNAVAARDAKNPVTDISAFAAGNWR